LCVMRPVVQETAITSPWRALWHVTAPSTTAIWHLNLSEAPKNEERDPVTIESQRYVALVGAGSGGLSLVAQQAPPPSGPVDQVLRLIGLTPAAIGPRTVILTLRKRQ